MDRVFGLLHVSEKRPDWKSFKGHLARRYNRIYSQLSRIDDDEFEAVGREPFDIWSHQMEKCPLDRPNMEEETIYTLKKLLDAATENINSLSPRDRRRLVKFWTNEIRGDATDQFYELVKEANDLRKQCKHILIVICFCI